MAEETKSIERRKKPTFVRQGSHKLKRIANKVKWRRPKGYHSKLKAGKAHRKSVSIGYGSPNEIKGKINK